jgi:hypothetical protein
MIALALLSSGTQSNSKGKIIENSFAYKLNFTPMIDKYVRYPD